MSKELSDLAKAIDLGIQAGEALKKSQMSLFGGDPHHVGYSRTNAAGTVSQIQAKGQTIQERPTHHGAASEEAENYSKRAWISDDTKDGHDAAEAALTHSAKLHSAAAEEADAAGDPRLAKWHDRKAILHRQMAEEHGAESHRMWQNEQQAKQVTAANEKLAAEKPAAMDAAAAAKHLRNVANKHDSKMVRKADNWSDAHSDKHSIPASEIAGTEVRHHTSKEVFGIGPKRYKDGPEKGHVQTLQDFTPEFSKKLAASNHEPFVLNHDNGNKYLVDTQGSDYARYIAKIKE